MHVSWPSGHGSQNPVLPAVDTVEGVTMPIPVQGVLASLNMITWIADESAWLLLASHDRRAEETMARLAGTLGLSGEPAARIALDGDHATLHLPTGSSLQRPVEEDWAKVAADQGRVRVAVGLLPMRAGLQAGVYAEGAKAAGKLVLGELPAGS
jgi:hypothetical protein